MTGTPWTTENFSPLTMEPAAFMPALHAAIDRMRAALATMTQPDTPATLETIIAPLESYRRDIQDLNYINEYECLNFVTPERRAIRGEMANLVSAFEKTLFQNPALGRQFNILRARVAQAGDDADRNIVDYYHRALEASGALIDEAGQPGARQRLLDIDARLIALTGQFSANVVADIDRLAILITDPARLAGLDAATTGSLAEVARQQGKDGWLIRPDRLQVLSMLARLDDAGLREELLAASAAVASGPPNDNTPVVVEICTLRREYASLLGYPSYAAFAQSRMATTESAYVEAMLQTIEARLTPLYEAQMNAVETFADEPLTPASVAYWEDQYARENFYIDDAEVAPFLDAERALDLMRQRAKTLFDLTFAERETGMYGAHGASKVFDVFDASGNHCAILLADLYARENKSDGAWMEPIFSGQGRQPAFMQISANALPPAPGACTRFSLDSFETLAHEFGHEFNALLSLAAKYQSHRDIENGPADRNEVFSNFNEGLAITRQGLKELTDDDGRPMGDALIDRLLARKQFLEVRQALRTVQNSRRDLAVHRIGTGDDVIEADGNAYLRGSRAGLVPFYPLTRFTHLFSSPHSNYSAGYFGYMVAQVAAAAMIEKHLGAAGAADERRELRDVFSVGAGGRLTDFVAPYLPVQPDLEPYFASCFPAPA